MEDRRQKERYPIDLTAKFIVDDERRGECLLIDISEDGTRIKFHSRDHFEIGTRIQLAINFPLKTGPLPAILNVRWLNLSAGSSGDSVEAGGILMLKIPTELRLLKQYIMEKVETRLGQVLDKTMRHDD